MGSADCRGAPCELDGPRPPALAEIDHVLDLVNAVFSPEDRTMGLEFPQLFRRSNLHRLRLFVDPATGAPAAHAGYVAQKLVIEGCTVPVAALGSVCTRPEYRGMGLASRLVQSIMKQAIDEGLPLMMISGDLGVYKRLGAVEAGEFLRVEAQREQIRNLIEVMSERSGWAEANMRPAVRSDITEMASIYRREPVRYVRSVRDFEELTWWRPDMKRLYSTESMWVAEAQDGCERAESVQAEGQQQSVAGSHAGARAGVGAGGSSMLGYVVARKRKLDDGRTRLHVAEYAGARWSVLLMVARMCVEYGPDLLTFTMPASDREMKALVRTARIPVRETTLPEYTIMSLNDEALAACAGRAMADREDAVGHAARAAVWSGLRGPELVRWIFGGSQVVNSGSELLPSHASGRLPLPVPGLNYI
ncbi:MAG: GNAT family N-acetyltransferase [Clostridia bacterium]|nr:GNAT family N-acetyltransferase [Clostridia bacterium]